MGSEETPDAVVKTVEERGPLNVAGAVPRIVADDTTDDLKILLGEFEGPLDLLLHLIRQEHVSIYDIPIARITDEYLCYLRVMQEMDIAVAGDFLVMAATLIELKTKMLLPRDPTAPQEEEDDPRLTAHDPVRDDERDDRRRLGGRIPCVGQAGRVGRALAERLGAARGPGRRWSGWGRGRAAAAAGDHKQGQRGERRETGGSDHRHSLPTALELRRIHLDRRPRPPRAVQELA